VKENFYPVNGCNHNPNSELIAIDDCPIFRSPLSDCKCSDFYQPAIAREMLKKNTFNIYWTQIQVFEGMKKRK
jgi:hypothetical protein